MSRTLIYAALAALTLKFAGSSGNALNVVGRGAIWKIDTLTSGPANRAK